MAGPVRFLASAVTAVAIAAGLGTAAPARWAPLVESRLTAYDNRAVHRECRATVYAASSSLGTVTVNGSRIHRASRADCAHAQNASNPARDECAGSHGNFADSAWLDPDFECYVAMNGSDQSLANQKIGEVGCVGGGCLDVCQDIEDWLETSASIWEWTGNWDVWDARWLSPNYVGFHYNVIYDAGLWAHEGYHGLSGEGDETWPNYYRKLAQGEYNVTLMPFIHRSTAVMAVILCAQSIPAHFGVGHPVARAQSASARVAAVQFALSHGLQLPDSTVVIAEPNYKRTHAPAVARSAQVLAGEATAMVTALGPKSRIASADSVLECFRSYCAASTRRAVLTVDEAEAEAGGTFIALVTLYAPSPQNDRATRTTASMVVRLSRSAQRWLGVEVLAGPTTARTKVPPA